MKQLNIIILSFLISSILFSCKIETSENGNLDGAWRMTAINDMPIDSVIIKGVSCSRKNFFWNINGKLLELVDRSNVEHPRFLLRFRHEDSKLYLYEPYIYDRMGGDKPLQDSTLLQLYGIDNVEEPFVVQFLDGSRMTLKSLTKKLDFRSF